MSGSQWSLLISSLAWLKGRERKLPSERVMAAVSEGVFPASGLAVAERRRRPYLHWPGCVLFQGEWLLHRGLQALEVHDHSLLGGDIVWRVDPGDSRHAKQEEAVQTIRSGEERLDYDWNFVGSKGLQACACLTNTRPVILVEQSHMRSEIPSINILKILSNSLRFI